MSIHHLLKQHAVYVHTSKRAFVNIRKNRLAERGICRLRKERILPEERRNSRFVRDLFREREFRGNG